MNMEYHSQTMAPQSSARISPNLLNLSAYIIIPAVGLPMLWQLFQANDPTRWIASGLLAAFTVMLFVRDRFFTHFELGCYVYTAVQTVLVTALVWLPPNQLIAVVLFFMLSAEASMMFPPRVLAVWITVFSAITFVAYLVFSDGMGLLAVPIYVAGYIFFAVFAQQTARAEAARAESQRLLDQLQEAHRQLQDLSAQAEDLVVAQERNRLAREMHDTLGHRLTVASVQLQAVERLIATEPTRAIQMTGSAREQVKEALADLRHAVATLRAPLEADLALEPALKRLTGSFEQATGITVHLALPEPVPELPSPYRQALYRGAQEGLTNIQKHAQATRAWLQLVQQTDVVTLTIRDNGVGVNGANGSDSVGFGLRGLRERATQLDGNLRIDTQAGGGAQLVLTLPLLASEDEDSQRRIDG